MLPWYAREYKRLALPTNYELPHNAFAGLIIHHRLLHHVKADAPTMLSLKVSGLYLHNDRISTICALQRIFSTTAFKTMVQTTPDTVLYTSRSPYGQKASITLEELDIPYLVEDI